MFVAKKKNVNLRISEALSDQFDEVAARFGHAKQKGISLSAAILMFLEAHPAEQGKFVSRVLDSEVQGAVDDMIREALNRQAETVKQGDASYPLISSDEAKKVGFRAKDSGGFKAKSAAKKDPQTKKPPKPKND